MTSRLIKTAKIRLNALKACAGCPLIMSVFPISESVKKREINRFRDIVKM